MIWCIMNCGYSISLPEAQLRHFLRAMQIQHLPVPGALGSPTLVKVSSVYLFDCFKNTIPTFTTTVYPNSVVHKQLSIYLKNS